jgi:hypothetical protein
VTPSTTYKDIWHAIRERKQITCTFDGKYREACPIILGYGADGSERVLVFQFGGETSPHAKLPGWRSFFVSDVHGLKLRDGAWIEGLTRRRQPQSHIQFVDVDANIPATLTRAEPLRFGSPALQPPRRR